jgi:hypothetical protein
MFGIFFFYLFLYTFFGLARGGSWSSELREAAIWTVFFGILVFACMQNYPDCPTNSVCCRFPKKITTEYLKAEAWIFANEFRQFPLDVFNLATAMYNFWILGYR